LNQKNKKPEAVEIEEKKESKIEKSKITEEDSPKEEDEHSKKRRSR